MGDKQQRATEGRKAVSTSMNFLKSCAKLKYLSAKKLINKAQIESGKKGKSLVQQEVEDVQEHKHCNVVSAGAGC